MRGSSVTGVQTCVVRFSPRRCWPCCSPCCPRHHSAGPWPCKCLRPGWCLGSSSTPRSLRRVWRTASAPACPSQSCHCRSEEHTSELQSHLNLVSRLLLAKKKTTPSDYF